MAGLFLAHLGHLPTAPGETVSLAGRTVEVAAVERRAITSIRLRPAREPVSRDRADSATESVPEA